MTIVEFFIEPTDSHDRYELNYGPASRAQRRLLSISQSLEISGSITFDWSEAYDVPANIVWVLVDGLGGAWKGKQRHPAAGARINEHQLYEAIFQHPLHNVFYFDM